MIILKQKIRFTTVSTETMSCDEQALTNCALESVVVLFQRSTIKQNKSSTVKKRLRLMKKEVEICQLDVISHDCGPLRKLSL